MKPNRTKRPKLERNQAISTSAGPVLADQALVDLIKPAQMSLGQLVQTAQQLELQGNAKAAENLYALWIAHHQGEGRHLALYNYAAMLQKRGLDSEAAEAYSRCIEANENFSRAYVNLGLILEKRGDTNRALQTWAGLIARAPTIPDNEREFLCAALNHIGRVQETLKNYPQAESALEQSLRLDPEQTGVIQHWVHIRQKACSWPVYKTLPGISYAQMRRATSPLAMLALTEDPAEQLSNSQGFVARTYTQPQERLCAGRQYQHQRLRIGYVSADFREHAVGFLLPPMLASHPADQYELYAYDFTKEENTAQRAAIKACFAQVRPIHALSDRQAAELILADEIDILIDLHGLSSGARPGIFALHPAPRQGTYLGFIGPSGMPWFDFVLADPQVLPEELASHFSEKPVYLNTSFIPLVERAAHPQTPARKDFGIAEHSFVMGAFGNTYKITPSMFALWMRLLQRIPESVLWLIDDNAQTTANLQREAQALGVAPERILFAPRTTHAEFCARLPLVDVYLDTYPYNCGSTTNDVVHAGVPFVTRYGKTMVSRMGLSILTALGAQDNATQSFAEYEDKVVELYLKKQAGTLQRGYASAPALQVAQALKQISGPAAQATGKAVDVTPAINPAAPPRLQVHHIAYSEDTSKELPAQFVLLDNLDNPRPDWREYWPMRSYLLNHALDDNTFYGFLSPKFGYKTGLDHAAVSTFAAQPGADSDVLIFSPFWDLNSLFMNSFLQGEVFHPGLLDCVKEFASVTGLGFDPAQAVTHADNTVFCNYFLAKKAFWLHWLELGERMFHLAENGNSALSSALRGDTTYGEKALPQKIFVQERLVNLLLASGQWNSRAYNIFDLNGSTTPLNQFYEQAVSANALKLAYSQTGNPIYRNAFLKLQKQVWEQSNIGVIGRCANPHDRLSA